MCMYSSSSRPGGNVLTLMCLIVNDAHEAVASFEAEVAPSLRINQFVKNIREESLAPQVGGRSLAIETEGQCGR
jgi:hypothetical protein